MSYRKTGSQRVLGFSLKSWIETETKPSSKGPAGQIWIIGQARKASPLKGLLDSGTPDWQKDKVDRSKDPISSLSQSDGPLWIVRAQPRPSNETKGHQTKLEGSLYSILRDRVGGLMPRIVAHKLSSLTVRFIECDEHELLGALVGLEMASYRFMDTQEGSKERELPTLHFETESKATLQKVLKRAAAMAQGINLARHLVNLGAGELHTKAYAEAAKKLFSKSKHTTVEVWDEKKLKTEGMDLHVAVGAAGPETSKLVKIKYRPNATSKKAPVALVGKGVVFDTGGLDLKPAGAMRLMKKDMGGSAALMGVALVLDRLGSSQPVDIYLALAENSVSGNAFRPGDVIQSRKGLSVEIHNTDAEGRLVLADALDLASRPKAGPKPKWVIDVATLTGAIKVGLGGDVAGMFSNSDGLSAELEEASKAAGEPIWRMPLIEAYRKDLTSPFADIVNCTDGFGGAITAALFLEKFVTPKTEWAHLDIFAWNAAPIGALQEKGGSGQAVQLLSRLLKLV